MRRYIFEAIQTSGVRDLPFAAAGYATPLAPVFLS